MSTAGGTKSQHFALLPKVERMLDETSSYITVNQVLKAFPGATRKQVQATFDTLTRSHKALKIRANCLALPHKVDGPRTQVRMYFKEHQDRIITRQELIETGRIEPGTGATLTALIRDHWIERVGPSQYRYLKNGLPPEPEPEPEPQKPVLGFKEVQTPRTTGEVLTELLKELEEEHRAAKAQAKKLLEEATFHEELAKEAEVRVAHVRQTLQLLRNR